MMLQSKDDAQLIGLYRNGNEQAFEVLLLRHKDEVYRNIYKLIKDEELANDFFQDTFIKIINTLKKGSYTEEGKFLPWAIRIAKNIVLDHFRANKKGIHVSNIINKDGEELSIFDILPIKQESIQDVHERKQAKLKVRKMIENLPYDQKEIVMLRMFYDMSFKEIADMYDISINTALGRMRYALLNLRKQLANEKVLVDLV